MTYGITSAGFNKKPLSVIIDEIKADVTGVSSSARFENETAYNNFVTLAGEREYALWNMFEAMYSMISIYGAKGKILDNLLSLNNIKRFMPQYSFIFNYEIEGVAGTIVPAGFSIKSTVDATVEFENLVDQEIPIGGVLVTTLRCKTIGPIAAIAGTVTEIVKNYIGINVVNHTEDAAVGRALESDEEVLIRRERSLALEAVSTRDGILKAIIALNQDQTKPAIIYADVIVNDDSIADSRGRPPHSIECIVEVQGGTSSRDQEIANTIFSAVGAGPTIFGEKTPLVVNDRRNRPHNVSFTNPILVEIYVKVDIVVEDYLTSDELDNIKSDIVSEGEDLSIGDSVTVLGKEGLGAAVNNNKIKTASMLIGLSDPATQTFIEISDGVLSIPEKAVFDTTRIDITQVV